MIVSNNAVQSWVQNHPLNPVEVDCTIAVMLKILDGKCKMKPLEKNVMAELYQQVKGRSAKMFEPDIHLFIADAIALKASAQLGDDLRNAIYEQRVLAETMISRPVMKAFKAMIRREGLLDEQLLEASTD